MFQGLPEGGLVILVGTPGSGKSTFAHLAFPSHCILSTDTARRLVAGKSEMLEATSLAHGLLAEVAACRSANGLLTVVDSTGTDPVLLRRLRQDAEQHGVAVHFVHVRAPVEECLRRNAGRRMGRLPDAAVLRVAADVDRIVKELADASIPILPAESFFKVTLSGKRAFLAMPVTEYVGREGFRRDKRALFERAHAALGLVGLHVTSAALHEGYGATQLQAREYARYDVDEIVASDCLLVCTTSSLSPDTYLEIGTAVGAGKPVAILLPERCHRSGVLRGLIEGGGVLVSTFEADSEIPRALVSLAARALGAAGSRRTI